MPLEIVHAYDGLQLLTLPAPMVLPLPQAGEAIAGAVLTRAIEATDLGGVSVHRLPVHGSPATVLVERSASAGLVVVGSHGRGELSAFLLGSVSRSVLHRSAAPVVIVRDAE